MVKELDLNLLRTFDAVMAEGSVKRAAKRIGSKSPAISQALSRLKDTLDCELFIRTSDGMKPTLRAREMWPGVRTALGMIRSAVNDGVGFNPLTARSTILLDLPAGSDALIMPKLAARVANAPHLEFRTSSARAHNVLNDLRYGESWLAFDYMPTEEHGFHCEQIGEQELVLVARPKHPALIKGLNKDLFQTLPHVAVGSVRTTSMLPVNELLRVVGMTRAVKFTVPGLLSAIDMISSQDLVCTLPLCTAKLCQSWRDVAIHKLPFKLGPMRFFMVWHERFDADPAHAWLRQNMREICASL